MFEDQEFGNAFLETGQDLILADVKDNSVGKQFKQLVCMRIKMFAIEQRLEKC